MSVEPADEADRRLGEKARQLVENIHAVVRGVQLLLMARGVDAAADLLVNGVHGVGRRSVKQGDRLLAAVGKFLLDDKARRDLVALVIILVRVEAVELGAQGDGLDGGRAGEVILVRLQRDVVARDPLGQLVGAGALMGSRSMRSAM